MSRKSQRFENVKITNMVDGTTIEGHEAVEAYFESEKKLLDEHGSTITFQVFRANLAATTAAEFQGEKLAEMKLDAALVTGSDSVIAVKEKLSQALSESRPDLNLANPARVTFYFGGRPMRDEKLFFADHFILLPAWVQVALHDCPFEEFNAVVERIAQGK